MSTIEEALARFDGKATTILSEIRAKFGGEPTFVSEVVRLASAKNPQISDGSTWLIKNCLEDGVRLTPSQTEDLVAHLDAVTSWQAQLHICQSLQYMEIPARLADLFAAWLTPLLRSDRPFLRAWSMDALQHLASRSPKLSRQAEDALETAGRDSSASVRARARRWRR
ncbi:hypothetical protein [Bauldia sp.]|uniref:hypothetical protein n=1 Tax=Bauldia sp. TaxID=2575872 RepID=UPI003BAD2AA4